MFVKSNGVCGEMWRVVWLWRISGSYSQEMMGCRWS